VKLKVLMLGWEFPPFTFGGLGIASYYISKYVSLLGNKVIWALPFSTKSLKKIKNTDFIDIGDFEFLDLGDDLFFDSYFYFETKEEMLFFLKQLIENLKINDSASSEKLLYILYSNISKKIDLFKAKVINYYKSGKLDFDLIHCHDWPTLKAGIALKDLSNKPLFVHVHSTEYDRSGFNPDPFKESIEREAYKRADKIFAISKRIKDIIVKYYGIDPSKIEVTYNGFELKKEHFDFSVLKEKKKKGYKIVLFMARLTLHKGPDYFLKAAKLVLDHLKKKNKDKVIFVVAGSGEKFPELVNMALDLGIADKVFFTGYLRGKEVEEMYKIADVFVLSSVSEPFGLTPLESIAIGKCPVIISKQSGVAEVLNHCFKVDFWDVEEMANKIYSLLEYDTLKEEQIKNAFEEIKRISWLDTAKKIVENYLKILRLK